MPRRVITAPGHDRNRSLGWIATWWIETFTVHGPGAIVGHPVEFGDEYTGFIVDCYALSDAFGRRLYDSAFLSRPKGADKSGLAAKLAMFEAFGPCRFAGFAKGGERYEFLGQTYVYAKGEPMGKPIATPMVRILATEEGQTGNTFATIHYNLTNSEAPLFQLQAMGYEVGKYEILLPGGGKIMRSTAGAKSKDGGLETFAVFDETHLYVTPGLREMYDTVVDNLGKRRTTDGTWYLETTTMFGPGEDSIAERTYRYADDIDEGRARAQRMLFDHRWGEVKDLRKQEELEQGFREAYGDAIGWNAVEDLVAKAYDVRTSEARTRRYRLNTITSSQNAWMAPEFWQPRGISRLRAAARAAQQAWNWIRPWDGDKIALGFDGSLTNDATALVAVRLRDRHVFLLHLQEVPDGPEAEDWQVDQDAVDAAVAAAFRRYDVVAFYADPPYWQQWVAAWDKEYGEQLAVKASGKSAIAWYTKRDEQMAAAIELLETAIVTGQMTHDDETPLGHALTRHIYNARRWSRRGGTVVGKEGKNSPKKIDAAVAAALAFQAAADAIAKKPADKKSDFVPWAAR
jgi:phage terminase large subunit-like protein